MRRPLEKDLGHLGPQRLSDTEAHRVVCPVPPRQERPIPEPPASKASKKDIHNGDVKFQATCTQCHVFTPNITPNLQQMSKITHDNFKDIVLHGARERFGMPRFDDVLKKKDAEQIHAYLINEQRKAYEEQQKKK